MLAADIAMSTTVEPHGYFPRLEREPKLQTNFARAVEQPRSERVTAAPDVALRQEADRGAASEVAPLAGQLREMLPHQALLDDRHGARVEVEVRRQRRPDPRRPREPAIA